jgi:ABC-type multidrug transport system fused ATPase/permease subunit
LAHSTIAHRIRTVVDGDLVLVMDRGRIVELAAPHELLARPESRFYR